MDLKKEKITIVIAGLIIGVIAAALVFFGNPVNMGFCIACFLRDTAGALGLHRAGAVQYIRPEIIGLVLGSFAMALAKKEFSARGGSAPLTRFVLGFFVMIGCLMFLGCPFRMILRLAGGDLNALLGLAGFVAGILVGVVFLNRGYSLGRTFKQPVLEGAAFPAVQVVMLVLLVAAPAFIFFSEAGAGPGALHAPILISLIAGLVVGALAQRTRLCMVGGIRDMALFRESKLLLGFVAIFASALVCNLILSAVTNAVTAPALVVVGVMMAQQLKSIDWEDMMIAAAAFVTIIVMVLGYSISNGIAFGFIVYTIGMIGAGKTKDIHPTVWVLDVIFLIYFWVTFA